jgi:hypothetical protein
MLTKHPIGTASVSATAGGNWVTHLSVISRTSPAGSRWSSVEHVRRLAAVVVAVVDVNRADRLCRRGWRCASTSSDSGETGKPLDANNIERTWRRLRCRAHKNRAEEWGMTPALGTRILISSEPGPRGVIRSATVSLGHDSLQRSSKFLHFIRLGHAQSTPFEIR